MKTNIYGIVSLICGIIGMMLACVFIGIFPAIVGIVFGIIGFCQKDTKYGTSIGGFICSIIAFVIFIILLSFSTLKSTVEEEIANKSSEVIEESISQEVVENTEESESITEETEEEYKASCQEYKYKDVLRNPEEYVGKRVKITVEISTVHEASWLNDTKYYFAYSDNDGSGYYFDDRYGIFDKRADKSLKLLEDDIITVYGEISDPQYTSSLIVSSSEIFCIDMKYLDFISD